MAGIAVAPPVPAAASVAPAGLRSGPVFPRLEASFQLKSPLSGANPFDYTQADVRVAVARPSGPPVTLPAFFDGGETWRVRYTPRAPGRYRVARVTLNGKPARVSGLAPAQWTVDRARGRPGGFVRRDAADPFRLAFDGDAATYYPVGHNVAWRSGGGQPDIPTQFTKMKAAGENWSRVWMNHWDNKNLDWPTGRKVAPGTLDLEVAKSWDRIVEAAEANGIRFQMTFQHHGQYSTAVNPNWGENPWNAANGGFLAKPEDFFTDARATAYTKAKYRYIIARWGYSPAVLAWELFNEVQFTDAARQKRHADIAAWHKAMAAFLRQQDPQRHLVTSSSDLDLPGDIFADMDYLQPHAYPPDVVAATQTARPSLYGKPIFFGEIGGSGDLMRDDGTILHAVLWSSLVSEASGAAQYWAWDAVERNNLYGQFRPLAGFLKATGLTALSSKMRAVSARTETGAQGSVSFGPGGGWGAAKQTRFAIAPDGTVEGVAGMPAFLQGKAHPELFASAEFPVELREPATFSVRFRQSAKAGARPVLLVDGAPAAEKEFPAADRDTDLSGEGAELSARVPAGRHTVRLVNTGADWAVIDRVTLTPYGATLRVLAKANADAAVLWVRNVAPGDAASAGGITLPAVLRPGRYRVLWWDTDAGKAMREDTAEVRAGNALTLKTPAVTRDVAAYVSRSPFPP